MELKEQQHTLIEKEWQARKEVHEEALASLLAAHLERKSRDEKNPVLDFLFEYYSFRPSLLMRWSPGADVALTGDATSFQDYPHFERSGEAVLLDSARIPDARRKAFQWIHNLLVTTQSRPPQWGCFGLHEWAMVYEEKDIRHPQLSLRLPHAELRAVVEAQGLRCTHFDAFRFFSRSARPLNQLQLTKKRVETEQPGCLHSNMDIYKWAYKGYPWISSDLIREAFFMALAIREVDMRASPYDCSSLGYEPICVETAAGRAMYQTCQQDLHQRAKPLREKLIQAYEALL